jgi:glycosyltransferase involved in cell wall biosynthesis
LKLHTVFITYNRLELTKRAIESYLETVTVPFTMWVVDNASSDGTQEWIQKNIREIGMGFCLFKENHYPGMATNEGWRATEFTGIAEDATHLHRADNDHVFLPGWCEAVEHEFQAEKVGLVGLRTSEEELHARSNTGGNCVIRRDLWDEGLRWDERTWPELRDQMGAGITEDSLMAPSVLKMGYRWTRVRRPCIVPISSELPDSDPDWPYYLKSFRDRGIHQHLTQETV